MILDSTPTHLKFSPSLLRRLGEELTNNIDQGILELVKNAYDADATYCQVRLEQTNEVGGCIYISDDGDGMLPAQIDYGWLLLGESSKATKNVTKAGRLPVGDKGLGRLAALRAGTSTILTTRPRSEPGIEYTVYINWDEFNNVKAVEDVALIIDSHETDQKNGTTIQIIGLKRSINDREADRLARSLFLLSDPFKADNGFNVNFEAPAFTKLQKLTVQDYFDQAIAKLEARINDDGSTFAVLYDSQGQETAKASHTDIINALKPKKKTVGHIALLPPVGYVAFDLWMFDRGGSSTFGPKILNKSEQNGWLDAFGGVHIFDSNIRVPPYGDSGDDWLSLNLRRAQNPQERPSTNNVVGRITLPNNRKFIQKTDRSGFVENEAFQVLKAFAEGAVVWASSKRHQEAEERREKQKKSIANLENAESAVLTVITNLPEDLRKPAKEAFASYVETTKQQTSTLVDELQLYRTLATVGTTTAVFIHDAAAPAQTISSLAREIVGLANLGLFYDHKDVIRAAEQIKRTTDFFQTFSGLPIKLLASKKREPGRINIHNILNEVMDMFKPVMDETQIELVVNFGQGEPIVKASIAAIEAIYANLLTNAYHAVVEERSDLDGRVICTETDITDNSVIIRVTDSGPGIKGISLDQIWLPGETTKSNGVGLGLKIVRDVVTDLRGTVKANASSELGGAEFTVILPTIRFSGK